MFLTTLFLIIMLLSLIKSKSGAHSIYDTVGIISMFLLFLTTISILFFFIFKRTTISKTLKKLLIIIAPVSIILYLVSYFFPEKPVFELFLKVFLGYLIIYSIILSFICYLEKVEMILLGLIILIIIGFILNRFGSFEGAFIIPFAFCLSSIGFIYIVFKTIPLYRNNKTKGLVFIVFYSVMAVLNALFVIKFMKANPALTNIYDTIGVVIYLLACLALFIILPFMNFTEWPKPEKISFKRLVITPLIMFLFLFSLKFLLPDRIYRNIFYVEYSQKAEPHFGMKDYRVEFIKK